MATSSTVQPELHAADGVRAVPASPGGVAAQAGAPVASQAAVSARHAIEVIAQAADAQASRGQSGASVSFNLRLANDNVTVRLEMRQGSVQTLIATSSPDLRAAIANEWSGLANGSSARTYTFSAPEFTAADGRPGDAATGEGGANRDPGAAPDRQTSQPAPLASNEPDPVQPPTAAVTGAAPTTRHLSAIA
jgi:hypothetical protein